MSEFIQLPVEGIIGKIDNKTRIHGVEVRQQRLMLDVRGFLMEVMRPDWPEFKQWGQVYVTMCNPGSRKAFHFHYRQIDSFNCVWGTARVVLFDNRPDSPTNGIINEFVVGPMNSKMIQIPNLVWHGFAAVGNEPTLIVNCPTETYDYNKPDEFRCPADSFGYNWDKISG